jgi:glycosyltransferase involved in cell wall biosynthesis
MKFLIVTFAPTLKIEDKFYSYAPYVNEMDIWGKHVTELGIISPVAYSDKLLLLPFTKEPKVFPIQSISLKSLKSFLVSFLKIPTICIQLYKAMQWADHIHLRCPGNIGLLGAVVQVLFPNKPKTVKYAGNWDPKSKQPFSYRYQKWMISNTFLTRNCKVLVYGEWPNQSKNIVPFFTASYSEKELRHPEPVEGSYDTKPNNKSLPPFNKLWTFSTQTDISSEQIPNQVGNDEKKINVIFVGALTQGKQPLLTVKVVHELKKKGYVVQLDIYGEGKERENLANYILDNSLKNEVQLHGNVAKETIKKAYQKAHFLVFISKSEGWPKVVAEAMCWGCVPITSKVSCIPYMLGYGTRGSLVGADVDEIVNAVEAYTNDIKTYTSKAQNGMEWSRQFTLEKFEKEIGKLLKNNSPL